MSPKRLTLIAAVVGFIAAGALAPQAAARSSMRRAFFDAYPQAVGSRLDLRLNGTQHCGVCHFNFNGGGPRNPYGLAVEGTANRTAAEILALGNLDSDTDGFSNNTEILDPAHLYANTPTFPGLRAANLGQVSNISTAEIQDYLTPTVGPDTTPPTVTVLSPNGGESYVSSSAQTINWTATDNSGTVMAVDILVSFDGTTFAPLAIWTANTGSFTWHVPNRPTSAARVRVVAYDPDINIGLDTSNAGFSISSSGGGRVPTTLRDFDMPGTQPFGAETLISPEVCRGCHGDYNPSVEPAFNWRGGMMAHASIDPLFLGLMEIANADAPESGDMCLRCHDSRGWLAGRSTPTDGSQMEPDDLIGVSCNFCHRQVDPIYVEGVSPPFDAEVLANLADVPTGYASGQYVVDPYTWGLRGPFNDAVAPHEATYSPLHRSSAICGICHDVSNPVFTRNPDGTVSPNAFDQPAEAFGSHQLGAVERTYSEWVHSAFNTPQGVFAPEFGGNRQYVSECQHCHMRAVTGQACNFQDSPVRTDLSLHDMTGGSTWVPTLLSQVAPGVDVAALDAGIVRARNMLQLAASLALTQEGDALRVRVTNRTGHKLPTGYPEGRRAWLNVRFYDAGDALVGESGAYDSQTALLTRDPQAKVYEAAPAVSEALAPIVGLPAGAEFHFVLNDTVHKDNRIPPQGFTNAAYAAFGGAPVGASYADGQNYDETLYDVPAGAVRAEVTLYYQSTSREFMEFLRDSGAPGGAARAMYDLWTANGKCPPEEMVRSEIDLATGRIGDMNCDGAVDNGDIDAFVLALLDRAAYEGAFPACRFENADTNDDGSVDNGDIDSFVALLLG